jgi:5-methylcytosine-specific restriction protein B
LITLIEADKRVCYDREGKAVAGDTGMHTTLPYSGISFGVPANVDIIGTMNTADRSIALLDIALRRRFEFQELMPTRDAIEGADGRGTIENGTIDLRVLLAMLNRRIRLLAGRDLQLGHAFFCPVKNIVQLNHCFAHRILPLLQEYFYGHWERMQLVLGDQEAQLSTEQRRQRERCCFILSEELEEIAVLGFDHDDHDSKWDYFVNPCLLEGTLGAEAYTKIYQVNHADVAGS